MGVVHESISESEADSLKKVHLVFDADFVDILAKSISQFAVVTGKDFTMDLASQWARSMQGEDPDIILIDGTVEVSQIDKTTGLKTRDQLFISRLREIRLGRPNSQVIILLPEDRKQDVAFLQAITSMAVFDFYFVANFNEEHLRQWFETKKNFADVQKHLPGNTLVDSELSEQKSNFNQEPQEEVESVNSPMNIINIIKTQVPTIKETVSSVKITNKEELSKQFTVVLGIGNQEFSNWFANSFIDTILVTATALTSEEFEQSVLKTRPNIVVIMRLSSTGGLPNADELAIWSLNYVDAVLFIAGELDEQGQNMSNRVKSAGGYVLSCPQGETISGTELVYLMQTIIRDITASYESISDEEADEVENTIINLHAFKNSALQISKFLSKTKTKRPNVHRMSKSTEEEQPQIQIRNTTKDLTFIVEGGLLSIVSPWRPGLAGRMAAQAAQIFSEEGSEVAVICATGRSTSAVWLGVSDEELIMSDWRIPGSQAPVEREHLKIWAVDPAKSLHMDIKEDLPYVVKEARSKADYTVIDFGEDIDRAQFYIHQKDAVLLCLVPGSDPVEQRISLLWLKRTLGQKDNIVIGFDLREQGQIPEDVVSKLVITTTPEEALQKALKKNLDQYIWR